MAQFGILTEAELDRRLTCRDLALWEAWAAVREDAIIRVLNDGKQWVSAFAAL